MNDGEQNHLVDFLMPSTSKSQAIHFRGKELGLSDSFQRHYHVMASLAIAISGRPPQHYTPSAVLHRTAEQYSRALAYLTMSIPTNTPEHPQIPEPHSASSVVPVKLVPSMSAQGA